MNRILTVLALLSSTFTTAQVPKSNPDIIEHVRIDTAASGNNIPASFPGGQNAWFNFLARNLDANVPIDVGAPSGEYTVIVQFVLQKDGQVTDIIALTDHGYGTEEEAIRVIKMSPPWIPATMNGVQVRALRIQPLTFTVADENKKYKKERHHAKNNHGASFPGGTLAWFQFAKKNLNSSVPKSNNAPIGTYEVIIEFEVAEDGYIGNFKRITNHGFGMEDEAIRLLRSGPYWSPAKADGRPVKSFRRQRVVFVVL